MVPLFMVVSPVPNHRTGLSVSSRHFPTPNIRRRPYVGPEIHKTCHSFTSNLVRNLFFEDLINFNSTPPDLRVNSFWCNRRPFFCPTSLSLTSVSPSPRYCPTCQVHCPLLPDRVGQLLSDYEWTTLHSETLLPNRTRHRSTRRGDPLSPCRCATAVRKRPEGIPRLRVSKL